MRNDVHFAALRAAAKVTFSVALLNGCSSADTQEPVSDEAALKAAAAKTGENAGDEPCPSEDAADAAAPKTCETVLDAAFSAPRDPNTDWRAQTPEVIACCNQEVAFGPHHWQCCSAYDGTSDAGAPMLNQSIACTPWGPPVPPSMNRARRASPEIAAWLAKAVA